MGAFLSHIVAKLLGDGGKPLENEFDGNICVCCGTLNVAEHSEHENDSEEERGDGD